VGIRTSTLSGITMANPLAGDLSSPGATDCVLRALKTLKTYTTPGDINLRRLSFTLLWRGISLSVTVGGCSECRH
ncbi:MAG TPA: hypothetical protein VHA82_11950, partial [Ramlibacter sp.]|uniref:hypothetical protein n=1 Tax=Ramlibacter sp. TaxID=1917967 RepID=UPI002C2BD4D5